MLTPAVFTRGQKEQRKRVERWMKRDGSPFSITGHPSGLVIQAEVAVFSLIHGRFDAFMGLLISLPIVPLLDYCLGIQENSELV